METIQNLIGVLKSQLELYSSLLSLLMEEKKHIAKWQIDKTLEITKSKDTLLYKERLLDEARDKISKKLQKEMGLSNSTLKDLIENISDLDSKTQLIHLRGELLAITKKIQAENMSIRILYSSNLKMISDFFEQIGLSSSNSYMANGVGIRKAALVSRSA